jgi:hypothetical protein
MKNFIFKCFILNLFSLLAHSQDTKDIPYSSENIMKQYQDNCEGKQFYSISEQAKLINNRKLAISRFHIIFQSNKTEFVDEITKFLELIDKSSSEEYLSSLNKIIHYTIQLAVPLLVLCGVTILGWFTCCGFCYCGYCHRFFKNKDGRISNTKKFIIVSVVFIAGISLLIPAITVYLRFEYI